MSKQKFCAISLLFAFSLAGCSGGVASTAEVHVSEQDLRASTIYQAKQLLDSIEALPPEQRQYALQAPRAGEILSEAAKLDESTNKRIDQLGLKIPSRSQNPSGPSAKS